MSKNNAKACYFCKGLCKLEFIKNIYMALVERPVLMVLFIVLSSGLQQWFPPYPGDIILLFVGYLAGTNPPGIGLFLAYFIPTLVSSWLLYEFALTRGTRFFNHKFVKRIITPEQVDFVFERLSKRVYLGILACKFLPGCNSIAILVSGFADLPRKQVYISTGITAFVHNVLFFAVGWMMGDNMGSLSAFITAFNTAGFALFVFSIIILVIAKYRAKHNVEIGRTSTLRTKLARLNAEASQEFKETEIDDKKNKPSKT